MRFYVRLASGFVLLAGGIGLLRGGAESPVWVGLALLTALGPIVRAWRAARGTQLGSAVFWMGAAVLLGLMAQGIAAGEPTVSGRPNSGAILYLATMAALAASISVLNARRPGAGAWAILMVLLVVVFLLPWLEGRGLVRSPVGWERLRLSPPWTIFFGLLVLTGVTNYLPTRFGPAAVVVGLAFGLAYAALTRTNLDVELRGRLLAGSSFCLAAAIWTADLLGGRPRKEEVGLNRLWLWFRDHWGVVWALRVQERFNRSAEASGWPVRLTWQGTVRVGEGAPKSPPEAAEATLKTLLRRFADEGRLDREGGA